MVGRRRTASRFLPLGPFSGSCAQAVVLAAPLDFIGAAADCYYLFAARAPLAAATAPIFCRGLITVSRSMLACRCALNLADFAVYPGEDPFRL